MHKDRVRIKEMITNLKNFDHLANSSCQYQRKCINESTENMNTNVRV